MTSLQPAQVARQLKSRNPTLHAAGIHNLGARMLASYHLIILSSSTGHLLGCNSLPQVAADYQHSGPRIQQISLNRWSRPQKSAKLLNWVPCLSQSSPHAPTGLKGPPQVAPHVTQRLQKTTNFEAKSATRQPQRQASTHPSIPSSRHPSIHSSGPWGRRQRR